MGNFGSHSVTPPPPPPPSVPREKPDDVKTASQTSALALVPAPAPIPTLDMTPPTPETCTVSEPKQTTVFDFGAFGIVEIGFHEHIGRRYSMEDRKIVAPRLARHPNVLLLGALDGHSGYRCAEFIETALPEAIDALDNPLDPSALSQMCLQLDAKFLQLAYRDHGTTAAFSLVRPRASDPSKLEIVTCNIGDSRVILFGAKPRRLVALTRDHKPENADEKRRIERAGGTVERAYGSFGGPLRVDGQISLSRAFGDAPFKKNAALSVLDQKMTAMPDITFSVAEADDMLVLFCDGFLERMRPEDMERIIWQSDAPLDKLAKTVTEASILAGSGDNHSIIIARFKRSGGMGFTEIKQNVRQAQVQHHVQQSEQRLHQDQQVHKKNQEQDNVPLLRPKRLKRSLTKSKNKPKDPRGISDKSKVKIKH